MVPFAQAVIDVAPDRVIWGTDWPHGNTFTPGRTPNEGDLLDLLAVIAPDPADAESHPRRQSRPASVLNTSKHDDLLV